MDRRLGSTTAWLDPWWVWQPDAAGFGDLLYRGFNLLEGLVWMGFGGLVLLRWFRRRRSLWEWGYAVAFALFGLTDFREAYAQSAPLVLIKGCVLGGLLAFRYRATRVWYPGAKLY